MTFAAAKFGRFLPVAAFAMATEYLMGLVDAVIAGHLVGEAGLSAVNLMQPVFSVVSFLALLVGTGTAILYTTEMGRFDRRRASEMLTQGLWCALGLGTLLTVLLLFVRGPALDTFGASREVRALAGDFWLLYAPCALSETLAFFLVSLCNADGNPRQSLFAYGAELAVHCAVSVPMTLRFGLGGCAFGTFCGSASAVAVLLLHFRRRSCSLRFVRHFSLADSWRIVSCAAGDASERICQALLFYVLNLYVIAKFGSGMLPVLAAVLAVLGLSEALDCVPTAVQPLAGVYLGERNDRLVRRVMRYAACASLAIGGAATAVLVAFPQIAAAVVGIDDPVLCGKAAAAVRIVAVGLVGSAVIGLYNSYCMFISKPVLAGCVSVSYALAFPCLLVFALGAAFGENGVWAALGAAPFASCAAVALGVLVAFGRRSFPLFLDRRRVRRSRVFDIVVTGESACAAAQAVGAFLAPRTSARNAGLAALLVEETLMTVYDRNAPRRIRAEVTVDVSDGITVVERDDGVLFDITDVDARALSFRSYFVSNLMLAIPVRRNMAATSFNRNVFRIDKKQGDGK